MLQRPVRSHRSKTHKENDTTVDARCSIKQPYVTESVTSEARGLSTESIINYLHTGRLPYNTGMARPMRIEYPGAFYHVINRGQRQEAIFDDDRDRQQFLDRLGRMANLFGVTVHGYCLMTNHYHLILETSEANLSRAVQWLNVSYAVFYNRRHQVAGHLFQGRFKAILVEANTYLEALSRYIHLNPVRVGRVRLPWRYAWSSCRYFVTTATPPDWLKIHRVLSGFGRRSKTQRQRYRQYVSEADPDNPSVDVVGGLLLGSEAFGAWARNTFLRTRQKNPQVSGLEKLRPKPQAETIIRCVAKHFHVKESQIIRRGAKKNLPRDIAIYLARELSGNSARDLGQCFGEVSGAAISARRKYSEQVITKNRKLRTEVDEIGSTIIDN